jgi:pyridoxamine 5'-phosphate oxidase
LRASQSLRLCIKEARVFFSRFMDLGALRKQYEAGTLDAAPESPFDLFADWFRSVESSLEPNAMALCTCVDNQPSCRIVLLKKFDSSGFVFYTNYNSRKAVEIDSNPNVAICFYWGERQVRIQGVASKISDKESDEYYNSRPLESRLGAWASPQSEIIPNREFLEDLHQNAADKFKSDPPRPPFWGGYKVQASYFEFWQGRKSRLHDRFRYMAKDNGWKLDRLAP